MLQVLNRKNLVHMYIHVGNSIHTYWVRYITTCNYHLSCRFLCNNLTCSDWCSAVEGEERVIPDHECLHVGKGHSAMELSRHLLHVVTIPRSHVSSL